MTAEDAGVVAFGELDVLIVQVLCGVDMLQHSPGLSAGQKAAGPEDGMERHIILPHELV